MRFVAAALLGLSMSLLPVIGTCVYGEPPAQSGIYFSVPFICTATNGKTTRCLADSFKPGLSAVLLGNQSMCGARTAEAFTFDHHVEEFEATRLLGSDKCFEANENEDSFRKFQMAIVGADPAAVRLVSLKEDKSPVPKEIELKARRLAAPHIEEPQKVEDETRIPISLSDAPPKVLRTENVALLIFDLLADGKPWEPGPALISTKGEVFLLKGACMYDHAVFVVHEKLYLTYMATVNCCGCGDINFFVYDLSDATPKLVYWNSKFSD